MRPREKRPGGIADLAPPDELTALLDRDPQEWRSALDQEFQCLDDVLAGRSPAVIYPAARLGRAAAAGLRSLGARVVAFGDGSPALQGTVVDGLPVVSPTEVAQRYRAAVILIASTLYDSVIREDLRARGCEHVVPVGYLNLRLPEIFRVREYQGACAAATHEGNRDSIRQAWALLADDDSRRTFAGKLAFYLSLDKTYLDAIRSTNAIYFDPRVYALGDAEIVVDGGAYTGDTLQSFLNYSSMRFRSYYAFEPDPANFEALARVAGADAARITAVHAGLGARPSRARILNTSGADSRLLSDGEAGGETVEVVSLDDYFEGREPPSFIKLDIEGAEADALSGAARVAEAALPALAISAYHFPSDLWNIPLLISRLVPRHSLFMRHYTREVDDTVCYAIPPPRIYGR